MPIYHINFIVDDWVVFDTTEQPAEDQWGVKKKSVALSAEASWTRSNWSRNSRPSAWDWEEQTGGRAISKTVRRKEEIALRNQKQAWRVDSRGEETWRGKTKGWARNH